MVLPAFFTLWMLLAAPSAPVQSEPRPDRDEPQAEHSGPELSPIESAEDDIESADATIELPQHPKIAPSIESEAPDREDDAPPESEASLELELTSSAGTRGEVAAESLLHGGRGRLSGTLGVGSAGGTQAAQRQWLRAQLGVEALAKFSLAALWQPAQAGAGQEQLLAAAEGDTGPAGWQISLLQQDSWLSAAAAGLRGLSTSAMEFSGVSLSLEGSLLLHDSGDQQGLRATGQLGAGLYSLTVPKSAAGPWETIPPWERLGERGLAWPARANGALGLSLSGSSGTASFSLGAGLPAQAGSAEGELVLSGEHRWGPATLALQLSLAHLWPSGLWQGGVTCAAKWRFLSG